MRGILCPDHSSHSRVDFDLRMFITHWYSKETDRTFISISQMNLRISHNRQVEKVPNVSRKTRSRPVYCQSSHTIDRLSQSPAITAITFSSSSSSIQFIYRLFCTNRENFAWQAAIEKSDSTWTTQRGGQEIFGESDTYLWVCSSFPALSDPESTRRGSRCRFYTGVVPWGHRWSP